MYKIKFTTTGAILIIFFNLLNCNKKESKSNPPTNQIVQPEIPISTPTPQPDFTKLTPQCFQASIDNPTHANGLFLSNSRWNDPSLLKVGDQYVMYASSDQNADFNIKIYRMTSTDRIHWALDPTTPILEPGPTGSWDEKSVETPSVVFFHNQYHLFYTGYGNSPDSNPAYTHHENYKIGHAVSSDGINNWSKDSTFIISATCPNWTPSNQVCNLGGNPTDLNAWLVGEPGATVFNNKIYLYFTGNGYNVSLSEPLQSIGITTSTDGINWDPLSSALEPDQTLYPRINSNPNWHGYSTPQPIVLNNKVHLFFDVALESPWSQLRLHHAVSEDGKSNWIHDSSAIFANTSFTNPSWTSHEIRAPSPLLDGLSLLLWFAGDDGSGNLGIGYSSCAL